MKKHDTINISHETPIALLKESLKYNDYEYVLAHLYNEEPEYKEFYKQSVRKGRHVLLDNSIFELGESFDPDAYAKIINDLRPTEYIVPDVLEDSDATIAKFKHWKENYLNNVSGIPIGVVQGKTYSDIKDCMKFMIEQVDRIAISFDYSYYLTIGRGESDWEKFADGRCRAIQMLDDDLLLPYNKSYHLLGCSLPQEFLHVNSFKFQKKMFTSMDTSNPIVHGLLGHRYEGEDGMDGLPDKQRILLADLIHSKPNEKQLEDIEYNVNAFRYIMEDSGYSN